MKQKEEEMKKMYESLFRKREEEISIEINIYKNLIEKLRE